MRAGETGFCDKISSTNLRWYRGAGKRTIWIGEHYIASTPETGSKMTMYSVHPEPIITEFDQGDEFKIQETVVSKDSKIMAIASTYEKNNKKLTKIQLYDVESQKEKIHGFVPGFICDEKEGNPFFDNDGKNIVVHTKVNDGLNSYTIDVSSDEFIIVEIFKHRKNTKQLCSLVDGYFAGIGETMVSIFDIKNSRDPIDISNFKSPTHVALNPNEPNKKAVIALGNGALYRYAASKNDELEDLNNNENLINFDDFE